MKFRVTPAQFLAVQNARVASQQDAPLDAQQTRLVLEALERVLDSVQARAGHIGQVNAWLTHLIEQGDEVDLELELGVGAGLLAQGGLLAFDDTGFNGRMW